MIKYFPAPDIQQQIEEIAKKLEMDHDFSRVKAIRSRGSRSRRTLARCHALPRAMQTALGMKAHYVIEIISEQFDSLSNEDRTKTLIHELMHIPKAFGGGFRHHDHVNHRNIERMYNKLKE